MSWNRADWQLQKHISSSKHYKPTTVLFLKHVFKKLPVYMCIIDIIIFFPFPDIAFLTALQLTLVTLLALEQNLFIFVDQSYACLTSGMGLWSLRTPVTQTMPCTSWTVKICAGSVWSWSTREDRGGTGMDTVGVMGAAAGAVSTVSFIISTNLFPSLRHEEKVEVNNNSVLF